MQKYFIPGCVGLSLDLDLRVRPPSPQPQPGSGNLEYPRVGIGLEKNMIFKRLGTYRSTVSGNWAEIESVHNNFSRSSFSFMSNNHESGWLGRFGLREFSPDLGCFKADFVLGRGADFVSQTSMLTHKITRPFKMS